MRPARPIRIAALLLLAGALLAGCARVEEFRASLNAMTPHERYAAALEDAGLASATLGRAWLGAADQALDSAASIETPFREVRYLDQAQPGAIGYRFALQRGQELLVDIAPGDDAAGLVFIDLFEAPPDSTRAPRYLASADSTLALRYRIRRNQVYLLRVQPELLRGGRFRITIQTDASLAFPVAGKTSEAIRSFFGDRRDGGRRQHHGVDIFAPRGTPALAAANAMVTRVRDGGLGGKVVWLRDTYGQSLYYAHLDTQFVRRGMRVAVGDTLGLVGNTGNARTTPPHLHFGIYSNGPLDPFPFIHRPPARPAALRVDSTRLGSFARVAVQRARLHEAPDAKAPVLREVPRQTPLLLTGGSARWYRVVLPDGAAGYLAATDLDPARAPLQQVRLAVGRPVRARPAATATAIDSVVAGATLPVLGTFETYLLVESPAGRTGWVAAD